MRVVIRGRRGPGAWGKGGELLTNSYSWALCSILYQCTSYIYGVVCYTQPFLYQIHIPGHFVVISINVHFIQRFCTQSIFIHTLITSQANINQVLFWKQVNSDLHIFLWSVIHTARIFYSHISHLAVNVSDATVHILNSESN